MRRLTINRANFLGMGLSGLGLLAAYSALSSLSGAHLTQGPFGSATGLSFLEEGWKSGQGKGYLWPASTPQLPGTELVAVDGLIATSPKARQAFPREEEISDLFQFIVKKSEEYGVSPLLVLSLIEVESGFRPGAVSRRGAVGLMQLLPTTAEEVARSSGMIWYPELLNDPKVNIELGLRYMKRLKDQFQNVDDVLLAYNIGPAAVQERLAQGEGESRSRDYVQRVRLGFTRYKRSAQIPLARSRHWARAWL